MKNDRELILKQFFEKDRIMTKSKVMSNGDI
jgi:hypothetical protein